MNSQENENPYEAPKTSLEDKNAPQLFNPTASAIFAVLFGLPVGCFLHAANWKRLGDEKYAKANIWIGIVWIIVLLAIFALIIMLNIANQQQLEQQINNVSILFGLPAVLGWYFGFGKKQKQIIEQRYGENYPRRNIWWGVLWGIIFLIAFMAIAFMIPFVLYFFGLVKVA